MSTKETKASLISQGYSEDQIDYAIMLLHDGVQDHQVVNSLRALKKMELEKAALLVRTLATEGIGKKGGGNVDIIFGIAAIGAGLLRFAMGNPMSGWISLIAGVGIIVASSIGTFRK